MMSPGATATPPHCTTVLISPDSPVDRLVIGATPRQKVRVFHLPDLRDVGRWTVDDRSRKAAQHCRQRGQLTPARVFLIAVAVDNQDIARLGDIDCVMDDSAIQSSRPDGDGWAAEGEARLDADGTEIIWP